MDNYFQHVKNNDLNITSIAFAVSMLLVLLVMSILISFVGFCEDTSGIDLTCKKINFSTSN